MFGTRPPVTNEVFHWKVDVSGFLNCHLIHHTPAPHQYIVRALATNLQPLGLLFLTRVVNCELSEFKTVLLRECFECANRLFTVSRVVIDQGDFFAFQVVAIFIQQIVNHHACCIPVVRRVVENPVKYFAIRS